MLKTLKRRLVYLLLRLTALVFSVLPERFSGRLGERLGVLASRLATKSFLIASQNLRAAGVTDVASPTRVFARAGRTLSELCRWSHWESELETRVLIPEAQLARLREDLEAEKAVLFVSAHLGNWELMAARVALELARTGRGCAVVARSPPNPFIGARLKKQREQAGLETLYRDSPKAQRRIVELMKTGGALGMLIDQDTRVPSVHVPFFGRPAATPRGAAEVALKYPCRVYMAFATREPGGLRHHIELSRLPELKQSGEHEARVVALTALMTASIEQAIRKNPESWVWFHERWKNGA